MTDIDVEADELLVTSEVATITRVPMGTLGMWRHLLVSTGERRGPEWFKTGRRVVYRRSKVTAWLKEREVATAALGRAS